MSEKLGAIDLSFWHLETNTTLQQIGDYSPLGAIPERSALFARVESTIRKFPRLKERVSAGRDARWVVDPSFELENHVQFAIDERYNDPNVLQNAVEKEFSTPLPKDRPPWKLVIFASSRENSARSPAIALWIFHHSLSDGLGCFSILHSIGESSGKRFLSGAAKRTAPKKPSFRKRCRDLLAALSYLSREALTPRSDNLFHGTNSQKRELRILDLPISALKDAQKQTKASINEILLTIVSGAAREYQIRNHAKPVSMRVLMPVSIRSSSQELALGNHLTAAAIRLPCDEEFALKRLSRICEEMKALKSGGRMLAFRILAQLNTYLPRFLLRPVCEAQAKRLSFICTNMPGLTSKEFLGGAPVEGHYGMPALMRSHGLAVSFVSYCEKICVSFVYDPEILCHTSRIEDCFLDATREFLAELGLSDDALHLVNLA